MRRAMHAKYIEQNAVSTSEKPNVCSRKIADVSSAKINSFNQLERSNAEFVSNCSTDMQKWQINETD